MLELIVGFYGPASLNVALLDMMGQKCSSAFELSTHRNDEDLLERGIWGNNGKFGTEGHLGK